MAFLWLDSKCNSVALAAFLLTEFTANLVVIFDFASGKEFRQWASYLQRKPFIQNA
jgi:hypothetical protein